VHTIHPLFYYVSTNNSQAAFEFDIPSYKELGRSVNKVIRLRAGRPRNSGSIPGKTDIFPIPTLPRPALWPNHLPIQRISRFLPPRVKQAGHEFEHSLPRSAEAKNAWSQGWISHNANLGHGLGRSSRVGRMRIQKYSIEV
jgi:hypothetical protein